MANWSKPDLSSLEVDAIDEYKNRDIDVAVMFDTGTITSIPENAIRFNVSSGVMQRRESGSWVTKTLDILSATTGTLSIARGGTGGTSISAAQSNLQVPPTSRSITGGNGLTGGGDLSSNRSITLGTPSSITDGSTNNVTSGSHTHAIDHATTSQRGIVQLNDTTTSTSTSQAGTANSVKSVNDKATPKTSSGGTTNSSDATGHAHEISSSSSVTSTSTSTLANSAAVKAANDLADTKSDLSNLTSVWTGSSSSVDLKTISGGYPGDGLYLVRDSDGRVNSIYFKESEECYGSVEPFIFSDSFEVTFINYGVRKDSDDILVAIFGGITVQTDGSSASDEAGSETITEIYRVG